jgi:hypothetical protein
MLAPRRREKGKLAVKRGRKALGPPTLSWEGGGSRAAERERPRTEALQQLLFPYLEAL